MPFEKKLEFLKSKLTPKELEITIKRFNEPDELSIFFDPADIARNNQIEQTPQMANKDRFG